jgi:hypothetical protein
MAYNPRLAASTPLNALAEGQRSSYTYHHMKRSIDKLEAGRELDALVAHSVMGWKNVQRLDIGKGGKRDQYRGKKPDRLGRWRSADVRHYSTNPTDAYLIAPRMKELGLWERYVKELSKVTRSKGLPVDWATPDQSCRAALKAVRARR